MNTANSILTKAGLALAAGTALALGAALPASAHITVSASSTAAGSYSLLSFSLPHGCDGSPTTSIAISLPEQILAATPTVVAGWEVEKVTEPLASTESDAHGEEVSERVMRVVYTSTTGGLAEGYRAQFDVQVRLPDLDAGTELGFPVLQSCADGEERWEGDTLPVVTLTDADGDAHGGDNADAAAAGHDGGTSTDATADSRSSEPDVLARAFGIGGLALGTVGVVLAIAFRRPKPTA